jgi:cell division protease FtsH
MELAQPKRYSDEMAWIMDQEIQRLLHEAESKASEILSKNRHILDPLAAALLKEEVLDKTQIDRIIAEAGGKAARENPGI